MDHTIVIDLPPGYRIADVLTFHGRDAEGVAEQVDAHGLRKGVLLDGVPTLLEIAFDGDSAHCRIVFDAPLAQADTPGADSRSAQPVQSRQPLQPPHMPAPHSAARLQALANDALLNVLGLRIDPAAFAAFARGDAMLGPVLARQPGLRIIQSATVFEALTWAIIGQQINLSFAIALRRTLILQAGHQHSSGLWCYPEARDVARLDIEQLTSRKFSQAKADTILRVAHMIEDGRLSLERTRDPLEVGRELLAIKGIGPWTVNYVLLRGFGYPDCSLHGDVAVRAALHHLGGGDARPSVREAERLLERYQPHRTMAAAYLWASLGEKPDPAA
ncbi:DNA-3-methyladenine glycosylase 2 [Massilia sp. YIM B02443]|uniref:DNA-3-methyladenine glycosylase 2 n=1 Tax=Massilia sp. YIM B02443 TaxID=3050127 RepID=UPI0025B6E229|nr:DNA-3-methyladenine glycosylase 2 [Massilia sp. YIM B02443]MDN4035691.1 DNA-3-methyladenine glycosylase 2 [Massilia sp. YIM B02443]